MQNNLTGLFGKLPAHGDFIYRDLPTTFINVWDEWLQGYVGSAKEQLGEAWLDVYLTSPIWRFAFSVGVIDENVWAGIMLPSVDRVGRYFPFSIATKLPATTNPTEFLMTRAHWYQAMEDIALQALDGQLSIDDLVEELNDSNPIRKSVYTRGDVVESASKTMFPLANSEQQPSTVLPYMLHSLLARDLNAYSAWSTKGSDYILPCVAVHAGLPQLSSVAAMMDGHWSERGWQQPILLNDQ